MSDELHICQLGTAVSDHMQMLWERPFGVMSDELHTRQPGTAVQTTRRCSGNGRLEW